MHWLPRTSGERLLLAALLALGGHLGVALWLDGLPPSPTVTPGLRVVLPSVHTPSPGKPAVAPAPPAVVPESAALSPSITEARDAAPGAGGVASPQTSSPAAELATGLPRFYRADELDKLAMPLSPIVLPDAEFLQEGSELQVYIDASGVVVLVDLPDGMDADYADRVRQVFLSTRFVPAEKSGQPVPSIKRIALTAEDL